jgi:thiol-disulfide isomerase/thioredoxin
MNLQLKSFLVAAVLLCGTAIAATPGEVPVGAVVGELDMQGLNTPNRKLSQYRGKPLIINVWASWCGPCRAEMASVERMAWSDKASKWSVIGISTDDHVDLAQGFLKRSNATLSHYIDKALKAENMLGADRLPLTVVIDAKGRVVGRWYGANAWDSPQALAWIEKGLADGKAPSQK